MSKTAWIIFAVIVVGILSGLVLFSRLSNPAAKIDGLDNNSILAASDANGNIADHVFGTTDGTLTLVEYGDFQCPVCRNAHPVIKQLTEKYQDQLTFIFRNFPITNKHPNALAAAAAAEAAGLQGKYWEMHNLVFESQDEWTTVTDGTQRTNLFSGYAQQLGLSQEQFVTDLANSRISQKISFDQALAKKFGVNGTPTFYLNGQQLDEVVTRSVANGQADQLQALIDQALGK